MQKNLFFSLICLFVGAGALSAQEPVAPTTLPPLPDKVYEMFDVQVQPVFPGGETEMYKYLFSNLKYPPLARENSIQGSVVLTFVINADGNISNVTIIKDIGGGCGKEAARVISSMPRWTPGKANGQPVAVRYTLPVRFKLEDDTPPPPPPATAEYPGGQAALDAFLAKNLRYPKKAIQYKMEGTVVVECDLGPNGELRNPKVVTGYGYGLSEEALRLVKKMPHWVRKGPGPGKVLIEIPFKLKGKK